MGRKQLTISMPEAMHHYIEGRVYEKGLTTISEYFRELVRHDQLRQIARISVEKRYGQKDARPPLASAARRAR
ncbi:hypothetical protein BH10ACI3_BH10ACI3_09570 [soil metagenome]